MCGGSEPKKDLETPATAPVTTPGRHGQRARGHDADATTASKSLYDRLAVRPITAVVDEAPVARTNTDPIQDRFFNVDAVNLKKLLVEFVCVATGGPCKYEGRLMEDSHASMYLVDDEFTALVEDLVGALDKFKVPDKEKGEILGALGPLKPTMVVTSIGRACIPSTTREARDYSPSRDAAGQGRRDRAAARCRGDRGQARPAVLCRAAVHARRDGRRGEGVIGREGVPRRRAGADHDRHQDDEGRRPAGDRGRRLRDRRADQEAGVGLAARRDDDRWQGGHEGVNSDRAGPKSGTLRSGSGEAPGHRAAQQDVRAACHGRCRSARRSRS